MNLSWIYLEDSKKEKPVFTGRRNLKNNSNNSALESRNNASNLSTISDKFSRWAKSADTRVRNPKNWTWQFFAI